MGRGRSLGAGDADLGEVIRPRNGSLAAKAVAVRVAVRLVVLVAAAADAEAIESRLDAIQPRVSGVRQAKGSRRRYSQFNEARPVTAKRTLSAVGKAHIHLPSCIVGVKSALARVDTPSDLVNQDQ